MFESAQFQSSVLLQFEGFAEATANDGLEDENAGEALRVDVFGKRVIGGEDDVDIDFALWCITVVLELQSMVMVRVCVVRVIVGCDSEWY